MMMGSRKLVLFPAFLLVCTLALVPAVFALRFEMGAAETKCFSEELPVKGIALVKYHVVSENPMNISVRVSTPYGNTLHHQERVTEGEFSFTASEAGTHMACFWISYGARDMKVAVELDWRTGVAAKDWASVAKRDKIEGMELELRKLEDTVQRIHDEMLYLRQREEEMHKINEKTTWQLSWCGIISIIICASVAGLQLWYLKSFFEKKKLI